MRLEQKKQVAEELASQLAGAGIIYLTDFTGLDVKAMTELRARLREEGVGYRVVKNTLMRRALEGLDLPRLEAHLQGPTGLVLAEDDPVMPAKLVKEFAREHEERPVVKIGVVDRRVVTSEEVGSMADLPPRDALLGSIAGGLTASVAGVVGVLEAIIRDIAYLAEQVAEKREAEVEAGSGGLKPQAEE